MITRPNPKPSAPPTRWTRPAKSLKGADEWSTAAIDAELSRLRAAACEVDSSAWVREPEVRP